MDTPLIDAKAISLYPLNMRSYTLYERVSHFRPDESAGEGPWEDPHDHDESLARRFKDALARQKESYSSTPDPYRLVTTAREIITRAETAGRCLFLLAPALKPIAAGLWELGPSDRENPGSLEFKFRDLDLS